VNALCEFLQPIKVNRSSWSAESCGGVPLNYLLAGFGFRTTTGRSSSTELAGRRRNLGRTPSEKGDEI